MKIVAAALLIGLCLPAPLVAQAKPPFSSCAWWQSLKADKSNELYLIGYAQGLVAGAVAYPLPDRPATDQERRMLEIYQNGQVELLQRPALVEDYINEKCGEARNASVRVYGLALRLSNGAGSQQTGSKRRCGCFEATWRRSVTPC